MSIQPRWNNMQRSRNTKVNPSSTDSRNKTLPGLPHLPFSSVFPPATSSTAGSSSWFSSSEVSSSRVTRAYSMQNKHSDDILLIHSSLSFYPKWQNGVNRKRFMLIAPSSTWAILKYLNSQPTYPAACVRNINFKVNGCQTFPIPHHWVNWFLADL